MKYEVVEKLQVATKSGAVKEIPPGKIINFEEEKAKRFLELGKIRQVETAPEVVNESRQRSLDTTMDAIMLSARDEVIASSNGKQFISNDEIAGIEGKITELRNKVLNGEAKLDAFRQAVLKWQELGIEILKR